MSKARTGLLVMNPKATTASMRTCEVLVGALSSQVDLRTVATERRGHAAELARSAAEDGLDVVVAFGGDGTVNEVVTGLLAKRPESHGAAAQTGNGTATGTAPGTDTATATATATDEDAD